MQILLHRLCAAWKACRQRGSILILTALALPVLCGGIGLAVDVGNVYLHKTQLQNAADAAALGGAYGGMNATTGTFDEAKAKIAADQYVDADLSYTPKGKKYQLLTNKSQTTKYYAVRLDKDVPLLFMKHFGYETMSVSAKSIAQLHLDQGTHWFNDLFIFGKKLLEVNSIQHPDNFNLKNSISSTFDGRIRYTRPDATINHSTQTNALDVFFTQKAKDENLTVNEAKGKAQATYDSEGKETSSGGGYWSKEQYDSTYDMKAYWDKHIAPMIDGATSTTDQNPNETAWNTKDLLYYDLNKANNNINLNINHPLPGDPSKPAYLVVKAGTWTGLSVININVYADMVRPLIFCLDPSDQDKWSQVHFNLHGHTFRGIIYAPNMNEEEGVLLNAGGGTLNGSIVAKSINLRNDEAHFVYEGIHEGGGTSGSGSASLTDDTDDIAGYESF